MSFDLDGFSEQLCSTREPYEQNSGWPWIIASPTSPSTVGCWPVRRAGRFSWFDGVRRSMKGPAYLTSTKGERIPRTRRNAAGVFQDFALAAGRAQGAAAADARRRTDARRASTS